MILSMSSRLAGDGFIDKNTSIRYVVAEVRQRTLVAGLYGFRGHDGRLQYTLNFRQTGERQRSSRSSSKAAKATKKAAAKPASTSKWANVAAKLHPKQERKQQHQQSSSGSTRGVEEPNHPFLAPSHKKTTSAVAKKKPRNFTQNRFLYQQPNHGASPLLKAIKFPDAKAAVDKSCDILHNNSLRGKKRQ